MRAASSSLVLPVLALVACGSGAAPSASTATPPTPASHVEAPPPSSTSTPTTPATADVTSDASARAAVVAYRASIDAWNAIEDVVDGYDCGADCGGEQACCDREIASIESARLVSYFERFVAPTLDCWWGDRDSRRDDARGRSRWTGALTIRDLEVVRSSAREVLLLDLGSYDDERGDQRIHEKAVLMRLVDDQWRIAGETGRSAARCYPEAFAYVSPDATRIRACRDEAAPRFSAATTDAQREDAQRQQSACLGDAAPLAAAGDACARAMPTLEGPQPGAIDLREHRSGCVEVAWDEGDLQCDEATHARCRLDGGTVLFREVDGRCRAWAVQDEGAPALDDAATAAALARRPVVCALYDEIVLHPDRFFAVDHARFATIDPDRERPDDDGADDGEEDRSFHVECLHGDALRAAIGRIESPCTCDETTCAVGGQGPGCETGNGGGGEILARRNGSQLLLDGYWRELAAGDADRLPADFATRPCQ